MATEFGVQSKPSEVYISSVFESANEEIRFKVSNWNANKQTTSRLSDFKFKSPLQSYPNTEILGKFYAKRHPTLPIFNR